MVLPFLPWILASEYAFRIRPTVTFPQIYRCGSFALLYKGNHQSEQAQSLYWLIRISRNKLGENDSDLGGRKRARRRWTRSRKIPNDVIVFFLCLICFIACLGPTWQNYDDSYTEIVHIIFYHKNWVEKKGFIFIWHCPSFGWDRVHFLFWFYVGQG